jgi:hypothetical protein
MRCTAFCIGLLGLLIVGCAPEEEPRGELSGKVTTTGGVLLKGGNIRFHPTNGTPSLSVDIGFEGTYRITTLPIGEYSVTVETSYLTKMHKMGPISAAPPEKGKAVAKVAPPATHILVPKKYESKESSGLKAIITGGPQVLDFECP